MRMILSALVLLSAAPAANAADPANEVKALATRLFTAMETRDAEGVRALFLPKGRLLSTRTKEGRPSLRILSVADFARMCVETKEPYREAMTDVEVKVEGDLATAWGRYSFRVGAKLTNCGTNAIQCVHTPEGWRIAQITSTIHTEGCETP